MRKIEVRVVGRGWVPCDSRVHAAFRQYGDGFCLCGHVAHREGDCMQCAVLGECCPKFTPCPREDADG